MPSSIVAYEPDSTIDTNTLYSELDSSYGHERPHKDLGPLKTDVVSRDRLSNGFECRIRYDVAETKRVRGGTEPIRMLKTARIRFTPDYVFFLDFSRRTHVEREVRIILNESRDEFTQARFTSGLVMEVTEEDADAIEEGYWKNPTSHTSTASLYGDVDDEALATRFNQNGRPTYAKFESEYFDGGVVGISSNRNSLAFWSDRSNDEKVNYFRNVVEPLL